jgi:hypothetical protein
MKKVSPNPFKKSEYFNSPILKNRFFWRVWKPLFLTEKKKALNKTPNNLSAIEKKGSFEDEIHSGKFVNPAIG